MDLIRVGIIDDHPAIVLGTTAILNAQPDLHVVSTASTARQLLARRERVDVILLDLVLADSTSPSLNIETLAPLNARIVAYTSGERPELIREAAKAGAVGMIRKSEQAESIVAAVRGAVDEDVVASVDWAAALDSDAEFVHAELTAREAEVLALYASGEAESIFAGYKVHVISGNQVTSEV